MGKGNCSIQQMKQQEPQTISVHQNQMQQAQQQAQMMQQPMQTVIDKKKKEERSRKRKGIGEKQKGFKKEEMVEEVYGIKDEEVHDSYADKSMVAFQKNLLSSVEDDLGKAYHNGFVKTMEKIREYASLSPLETSQPKQCKKLYEARRSIRKYLESHEKLKNPKENYKKAIEVIRSYKLYFDTFCDGYLEAPPKEQLVEGVNHMDWSKKEPKTDTTLRELVFFRDAKKEQLFPHEPSVNDIRQRGMGDCYLLAALSSMVANDPASVKRAMKDNGDGTVTVRFFKKELMETNQKKEKAYNMVPLYVTVKKTVPAALRLVDMYGADCLWVQMIEKAYAASGLHNREDNEKKVENEAEKYKNDWIKKKKDEKNKNQPNGAGAQEKKIELNEEELREAELLKQQKKEELMGKNEPKWHTYGNIEGGHSSVFLENFTGIKAQRHENDLTFTANKFSSKVVTPLEKEIAMKLAKYVPNAPEERVIMNIVVDGMASKMSNVLKEKFIKAYENKNGQKIEYTEGPVFIEDVLNVVEDMKNWFPKVVNLEEKLGKLDTEENRRKLDAWIERIIEMAREVLQDETGVKNIQHRPMTGKYTQAALREYETIEKAIKESKCVNAGSYNYLPKGINARGLNKENLNGGLAEGHAYTVLGVQEMDGKKFVKLRNPWAMGGMQYLKITKPGQKDDQPQKTEYRKEMTRDHGFLRSAWSTVFGASKQGTFFMELNDFMTRMDYIYYNSNEKLGA